jgi:hypothetical protein
MAEPHTHRMTASDPVTTDPAAAMARAKAFARRVLTVPKSEIPPHVPTKRTKPVKRKRKPDA